MGDRSCYGCGGTGHIARNCPEASTNEGGFQGRGNFRPKTCFNCGGEGHISRNCPTSPSEGGAAGGNSRACFNCKFLAVPVDCNGIGKII
mmetsp:Transcript_15470/g.29960  ORF Transcript_15470/g.29960 Transcript_15470/m.29960 type:complete len:90 (+) Transcript_15470:90-359(+)